MITFTPSAAQARSLASHMHNEDEYFQYFALDFNEGYSALHGSDILAQAYVANQALHVIQNLYKSKKNLAIGEFLLDILVDETLLEDCQRADITSAKKLNVSQ